MGLVEDSGGDSNKAKNIGNIYKGWCLIGRTLRHLNTPSRRVAAAVISALVTTTGCAGATPSHRTPRLIPAGWAQIARGHHPSLLLIDEPQSTRDRHSECFIHYTARVVAQTPRVIRIEVLQPSTHPSCPTVAVRGPFLVPVHLRSPYRGQRLVDADTGLRHPLLRLRDLS